jgi:uncharacterized coiled-coil protein SlyX
LTSFSIFSATGGGEAAAHKIAERFFMDKHFLKFWGNFLLQAAEGQKRSEDLARWMAAGFSGAEDLTRMFQKAYGLKPECDAASLHPEAWEKAAARFQKAFSEFLELFGAVARSRYEALRKEKEALEKKIEAQAKTIAELRAALAESRMAEGKILSGFQQLMDIQNEQFRQVSDRMGRLFPGGEKNEEKR